MNKMQRFDIASDFCEYCKIEPSVSGDYVKWSDVEPLLKRLELAEAEVKRLTPADQPYRCDCGKIEHGRHAWDCPEMKQRSKQ